MSDNASICPECKKPLSKDSPGGLCPNCLMAMNMATQTLGEDEAGASKEPPPALEEIARFFPNFELLECLGRGGMGVVYKAVQKSLNRVVAIKILAPERKQDEAFAKRFVLEAETLAKLSHPNIVTIHDFGQAEQMFYLVMEFVDGVTLRQLLKTGRIAPREALAIVPQICDALQYAHDQGIVHRDIKPENIILDRRGRVKVADFGIAKILGESTDTSQGARGDSPASALTEAGKVVGTPNYMAPEQIENPASVDHRADIYALGVVFYQMLTGELPGRRIEPPSKVVHVDVRLDEVVLRAMEKDPERRYSQASVLKTNVETIAATPPPAAGSDGPTTSPAPPTSKPPPRISKLAVAGAFILLVPIAFGTLAALVFGMQGSSGFDLMAARKLVLVGGLPFLPTLFLQCILGWIAVAQIQKSDGRLYGMGLALFDGLLLPLLVLNSFILVAGWAAFKLDVLEGSLACILIDALLLLLINWRFRKSTEVHRSLKLGVGSGIAAVMVVTALFLALGPLVARNPKRLTEAQKSLSGKVFTSLREQGVRDLIDLDTGTLMPLPIPMADSLKVADPRRYAWLNDDKTSFAWMRARGIDGFQGNHGLIGIDMLAVEISPPEFESLRADEVEARVNKLGLREVPSTWNFGNVSGTYAIRTRQGNYGLLRLDPNVPDGLRVWWKMVGNEAGRARNASWASLLTGSPQPNDTEAAKTHEFSVEHNPKHGTKALDACRSFVREHQWKLLGESGGVVKRDGKEQLTVTMSAADRNGRKVTFTDEQRGSNAVLTIATEEGIELPAARIGVAICERLGWATPGEAKTRKPPVYGDTYIMLLSGEGDENKRFIDLDSGKRFAASEFFGANDEPSPEETRKWWRDTGIDACADTSDAVQGLVGFEMVVSRADPLLWTSPERLDYYLQLGQPGTPAHMPAKGQLPATFAFQTREGGRGVLQTLEISKEPAEIKFQYKLVK